MVMAMNQDYSLPSNHQLTISQDEEEKLVKRLYYRQMDIMAQREAERENSLKRMRPQKSKEHISKEEEERLIERIYNLQLQRFQLSKEERERKANAEVHKNDKVLSSSEIEDQVRRMYDIELEKSKKIRQDLENRYFPRQETKKIGPNELKECVQRLSFVDYEKMDRELFEKYVYPHDPKTTVITRSQEEAMADRLSTLKSQT
ncbi:unnamed protein product [Phytomonas sp. Hart1]|nr:unnamed protein product [Phytomonas sp. Hart1]|eukprot:CCW67396.1 unnamed protein product [Phytomonas sp. isolate Hart1]